MSSHYDRVRLNSGGRCPMHPLVGLPCDICGEAGKALNQPWKFIVANPDRVVWLDEALQPLMKDRDRLTIVGTERDEDDWRQFVSPTKPKRTLEQIDKTMK